MDEVIRLTPTEAIAGTAVKEGDTLVRGDRINRSRKGTRKSQVDEQIEAVEHALDSTA